METEGEDKPAEEKSSSPVDVISVYRCIITIICTMYIDNFNGCICVPKSSSVSILSVQLYFWRA